METPAPNTQPINTLFISYNGALQPLLQSQGIPYLEGLTRHGFRPVLLTFERPDDLKKEGGEDTEETLRRRLRGSGLIWRRLIYHKRPTVPATFFDIALGTCASIGLVLKYRIRLIHCRATIPALIGFLVSRLTRTPLIFDLRGLMAEEYADGGMWKKNGFLYRLTRWIEKRLLVKSDARIVLSENIATFLKESDYLPAPAGDPGKESTVIPCCVDSRRFSLNAAPALPEPARTASAGRFVLLYSGSLGTWYLLDQMLDFFQELRLRVPAAHFVLATHTGTDAVLRRRDERRIPQNSLSVIEAAFAQMPGVISAADAGIFFIKPVFSKRSSCPIKFAEYLACGKPVVLNAGIGDTDAIVEKRKVGVVIKSFHRRDLSDKISELLALLAQPRSILAQRCAETAEELFGLAEGIERYAAVYRRVLARSTP